MALKPSLAATLTRSPRIGDWLSLAVGGDGPPRWLVRTGKVEIGQGIHTALRQIAASALGADLALVAVAPVSTAASPDEGTTSGSRSVEEGGALLQGACLSLVDRLRQRAGRTATDVPGGSGDLLATATVADLDAPVDPARVSNAPAGEWIGRDAPAAGLMAKLLGEPAFLHDMALDGMLHARVLRGRWHRAVVTNAAALRASLKEGVRWFEDGGFVALLGDDEDRLVRAWTRCQAAAEWSTPALGEVDPNDRAWLTTAAAETTVLLERDAATTAHTTAGTALEAVYTRPYLAHAAIGPSCALARRDGEALTVWSHSQSIHALRAEIAGALGVTADAVVVHHRQGSGCYGHNGADDAAFDAALLAWQLQRPVRVQWMREDEFSASPAGPATVVKVAATLDGAGRIHDWRFDSFGPGHHSRPGTPARPRLLAAWQRADAVAETPPGNLPMAMGGGQERNALPLYAFDGSRVAVHRVVAPPVRSSSLRGLGALANVFAIESFMDELAAAGGIDPVRLRLDHLDPLDPDHARAAAVLRDAIARSPWAAWRAEPPPNHGIGCALARYKGTSGWCAAVACVSAEESVRVHDLYLSVDVGAAINPDGVRSQVEGGAVQATSWALVERLGFDAGGVATTTWESYPIVRFGDAPAVHVHVLDRPGEPALGAGEMAQGPTAAAIANALAHALGVRVRDLPMTFERVAQAIGA